MVYYALQLALYLSVANCDTGDAYYTPAENVVGFGFTYGDVKFGPQTLHNGFDSAPFILQTECIVQP